MVDISSLCKKEASFRFPWRIVKTARHVRWKQSTLLEDGLAGTLWNFARSILYFLPTIILIRSLFTVKL